MRDARVMERTEYVSKCFDDFALPDTEAKEPLPAGDEYDYGSLTFKGKSLSLADREHIRMQVRSIYSQVTAYQELTAEFRREIGKSLLDIKDRVDHGQFMKMAEACFGLHQRTVNNYMLLARFDDEDYVVIAKANVPTTQQYMLAAATSRQVEDVIVELKKNYGRMIHLNVFHKIVGVNPGVETRRANKAAAEAAAALAKIGKEDAQTAEDLQLEIEREEEAGRIENMRAALAQGDTAAATAMLEEMGKKVEPPPSTTMPQRSTPEVVPNIVRRRAELAAATPVGTGEGDTITYPDDDAGKEDDEDENKDIVELFDEYFDGVVPAMVVANASDLMGSTFFNDDSTRGVGLAVILTETDGSVEVFPLDMIESDEEMRDLIESTTIAYEPAADAPEFIKAPPASDTAIRGTSGMDTSILGSETPTRRRRAAASGVIGEAAAQPDPQADRLAGLGGEADKTDDAVAPDHS